MAKANNQPFYSNPAYDYTVTAAAAATAANADGNEVQYTVLDAGSANVDYAEVQYAEVAVQGRARAQTNWGDVVRGEDAGNLYDM